MDKHNPHISFTKGNFEQVVGITMGSTLWLVVANLYIEYLSFKEGNKNALSMAQVCDIFSKEDRCIHKLY